MDTAPKTGIFGRHWYCVYGLSRAQDKEATKMFAVMNQAVSKLVGRYVDYKEVSEGLHAAQSCILSEFPGAAAAVITLMWIVSCFAGLTM